MPIGQLPQGPGLPEAVVLGEADAIQPPVPGYPDRLLRVKDAAAGPGGCVNVQVNTHLRHPHVRYWIYGAKARGGRMKTIFSKVP